MAVTTTQTNKPINPRGNDQSPKGYNRASLFSGKALDFDGVNDSISEQTISIDTTSFSVSVYAKGDALGSNSSLLSFGDNTTFDLILYPYDSASSGVRIYDKQIPGTLLDGVVAELGVYNMFTMQCDGEFLELYINGQFVKKSARTYSSTYTRIQFGKVVTISQWFNGQISNAKVFDVALTAAQVADLYNNPEKVVPTGVDNTALKLWLPMQEGAGTTAYDGSGNGNHGTISGATWTHGIGAPVSQTAVIDWNKLYQKTDADDGVHFSNFATSSATEVTYSAWVYTLASSGVAGSTRTISEGVANQSIDFKIGNDGIIGSVIQTTGNSFAQYNTTDHINKLSHIAFTAKRNGNIKVYLNGSEVATSACADYDLIRISNINVHNESVTGGSGFRGYIADLAVYGRELNATEISNLYNLTNPTTISNCELYATNAGGFIDKTGNASVAISGSPIQALFPQGLTSGRDITGVNLFENVRKQGALNLDGNSWAEVHDNASLDITDEVTLEAWVYYVNDTSMLEHIIGKRASSGSWLRIYSASANTLRVERDGGAATSNVSITENAWSHIVATIDTSDTIRIYVNGTQQTSKLNFTPWGMDNEAPVSIGAWVNQNDSVSSNSYTNGSIAQPRIYNRALTAEEVARNYNSGKNIYTNS